MDLQKGLNKLLLLLINKSIQDVYMGSIVGPSEIAPRLKCYKNASRLNRYNFPTDNAIDFLFSTLHTTPLCYEVLKIGSR